MKIENAVNVDDLRKMAKRRLPPMVFDVLEGGAEDEYSLRANRSAWQDIKFRPRPFADVAKRDLSTTVFGETISTPLMLAPTGAARMASSDAELSLARGAGRAGTIYAHSGVASFSLEDVAAQASGPLWYQLYFPPDRDVATRTIKRVQDAGYRALVVTIDSPVRGARERDVRNKFRLPYKVTPTLIAQGLSRPVWSAEFLRDNVRLRKPAPANKEPQKLSLRQVESALLAASWPVTWADLEFIREVWKGPLLVKGLMRSDECDQIIEHGVDGIIVSNHGGRQFDGVPGTIEVLPSVAAAVGGRIDVFVDGGIRRGSDIVKAIALGAKACLVGRPYLYALAAGGEPGLARMLDILRVEFDRSMALLGCRTVDDIDASLITGGSASSPS